MRKSWLLPLLMAGIVWTGGLSWAAEPVQITGRDIRGDTKRKITYIRGDVRIVQGIMVIGAQNATIDMDRKNAILENSVRFQQAEITIAADYLGYDLHKKTGTFQRRVRLDYRPTPNRSGKLASEPFNLTCQQLYFEADSKNFSASQEIRVEHSAFNGSADRLDYQDKSRELLFRGRARLNRPAQTRPGQSKEPFQLQSDQIALQTQTKNFTATGNAALEQTEFQGTADRIDYRDNTEELLFQGHVAFGRPARNNSSGTTITNGKEPFQLTSDRLSLASSTKNFTTSGGAKLVQNDFVGTAAQMMYNDNRQELTLSGNVQFNRIARKNGSLKEAKNREPFQLMSNQLVLAVNSKNFVAAGQAALDHPDFRGTADQIEYDDLAQRLLMKGHAVLKRPQGETVQGEQITINLDDKSFIVNNKVNLSFDVKQDDNGK